MKKLFFSAVLLSVFTSVLSPDVENGEDSVVAIEYLANNGTLAGYSDGTFRPDTSVNRAELAKILVAGQRIDPDTAGYTHNCFPDVKQGEWYEKYVCYAFDQGWVAGYPDGTFLPGNTVNRAEAAKMITNGMGWSQFLDEYKGFSRYYDVSTSDWFVAYVNQIEDKFIETYDTDYSPADSMTRRKTAQFIFRMGVANTMGKAELGYSYDLRLEFLTAAGVPEYEELATPVEDSGSDSGSSDDYDPGEYLMFTLQSYGDLTITNNGATADLTGYYIEDTYGTFRYTFSGTFANGDSMDVSAESLLDYSTSDNELTLYTPDGWEVSTWSGY
jgi:hypothetical protein